jgi:hypothetical protein
MVTQQQPTSAMTSLGPLPAHIGQVLPLTRADHFSSSAQAAIVPSFYVHYIAGSAGTPDRIAFGALRPYTRRFFPSLEELNCPAG